MTGVAMPDEGRLPSGPARDLTAAIHDLYSAAGKPGTRKISKAIRERDDLPDTVSHEAVRAILGGARSRWQKIESVVRQLAAWSATQVDVSATVEKIHRRWLAVEGDGRVGSDAQSAVLRQAIGRLHRPTYVDAIDVFMKTMLYVPQAGARCFVVAATPNAGLWVCAFTSLDRLRAHQEATRQLGSGDWTRILGIDLVRRLADLQIPAGILVDPVARAGLDATETLPLPEDLVAELADAW